MKLLATALIMLTGIFMSCNKGDGNNDTATVSDVQMEAAKPEDKSEPALDETSDTTSIQPTSPGDILQAGNPAPGWEKKIIKTADITLELKDYKTYNASIHNKLKSFGAYIASEEQVQNEERIENIVTIKVPVLQFDELMNSFNGEGIKVVTKKISTEDVTAEVVDTKARIDAKKQVRARYLELLKQAKNMEEILQVQNEINAIQEDLETAEGRVKYLVQQSAYSTIHLVYYQFQNGATSNTGQPGFFTRLQEAFNNGGFIIKSAVLFIVTIWPLIFAGFLIWFFVKKWKRVSLQPVKKL
jgi:uncharacterized protein (DUF1330 family)